MKILIFWDSIARWAFDDTWWWWAERLKTNYLWSYSETWIWVYNMSVSSNDTRGLLKSMKHDLQKIQDIEPEDVAIIIAVWTNDPGYVWSEILIPRVEFKANFKQILSLAQDASSKVAVLWWFAIDEWRVNPRPWTEYCRYNNDMLEYTQIMEKLARDADVSFIDLRTLILQEDLSDGLHPNVQWHKKIFDIIQKFVDKHWL